MNEQWKMDSLPDIQKLCRQLYKTHIKHYDSHMPRIHNCHRTGIPGINQTHHGATLVGSCICTGFYIKF